MKRIPTGFREGQTIKIDLKSFDEIRPSKTINELKQGFPTIAIVKIKKGIY